MNGLHPHSQIHLIMSLCSSYFLVVLLLGIPINQAFPPPTAQGVAQGSL